MVVRQFLKSNTLRLLHCSEIEPSTSEQRSQWTNYHPRLDGVTTHTQHINTKFNTNSFIYILYFKYILNFYLKLNILYL
jgi:hypothetical protein